MQFSTHGVEWRRLFRNKLPILWNWYIKSALDVLDFKACKGPLRASAHCVGLRSRHWCTCQPSMPSHMVLIWQYRLSFSSMREPAGDSRDTTVLFCRLSRTLNGNTARAEINKTPMLLMNGWIKAGQSKHMLFRKPKCGTWSNGKTKQQNINN